MAHQPVKFPAKVKRRVSNSAALSKLYGEEFYAHKDSSHYSYANKYRRLGNVYVSLKWSSSLRGNFGSINMPDV